MKIAGIDYSLTSPSICVHSLDDEWNLNNSEIHYMMKSEKNCITTKRFKGSVCPKYESDSERYDNLSKWIMHIVLDNNVDCCYIEGYSYNSVGRVFQIAENTGILKHSLWKHSIDFNVIAPTTIKKFATGKGNSNKVKMYDCFLDETGVDIFDELSIMNRNQWNPVSDIVDAYFICKMGHEEKRRET